MSIARHHSEWLSLVEASGPFLSLPVLLDAFPQGLDKPDAEFRAQLRLAHPEWQASHFDPAIRTAWFQFVRRGLGWPAAFWRENQAIPSALKLDLPAYGETLRPDGVLMESAENGAPRVLFCAYPPAQKLDGATKTRGWNVSPAIRMAELLRATETKLGLVSNGENWMLVHLAPGQTASFISWNATLWLEEPLTWAAFVNLLGGKRLFGVLPDDTLENLFERSLENQQEVTDRLGLQVRRALELLVSTFERENQNTGGLLLKNQTSREIYEAALAVMMRLVFLFCAEERGMLPLETPFYSQNYAVSTLRAELREEADAWGEEFLERQFDAWCRLLSTFRVVYRGINHEKCELPAYGGNLFDPNRHAFLEGRAAGSDWETARDEPLPVDNRTVLHLLEALQILQVAVPGGGVQARLVSFRALDIEQIGHVYEGLLDHTVLRAETTRLSLKASKNDEPEIPLETLEALASEPQKLVDFVAKNTGRSKDAIKKELALGALDQIGDLNRVCSDENLVRRVLPFAHLVRRDSFNLPVVIRAGSLFVTRGSDRRASGTHYTPRSLTEPLVAATLEPLVYRGFSEGIPASRETLKSARAILDLKVCDPACGSAGVLVQVCRYLSERLVESWELEFHRRDAACRVPTQIEPTPLFLPYAEPHAIGEAIAIPAEPEERALEARRLVADRCIFGVDSDPLAVEMAQLSLWLITMAKGRPFSFLEHAIRVGDSLAGVDLAQLRTQTLDRLQAYGGEHRVRFSSAVNMARTAREKIHDLGDDEDAKRAQLEEAQRLVERLKLMGDAIVAPSFADLKPAARIERAKSYWQRWNQSEWREDYRAELRGALDADLGAVKPFHWPLEFPDAFFRDSYASEHEQGGQPQNGGFDAIVGNPPFMGGQRITGNLGVPYRDYLIESLARGKKGSADLVAYFYLRAFDLLRNGGTMGLIATNTIAQGDTREVGLDQLAKNGTIYAANPSQKWPGTAALEVALVHLFKGAEWKARFDLAGQTVSGLTPYLAEPGAVVGNPHRLAANAGKSFIGSYVLGMGFVLTPEAAADLIARDAKNAEVLQPYLNGEDLNSRPDSSPSRWVINFRDWPLDRESAPEDYDGPVAADYPDCLEILERLVKPERTRLNDKGEFQLRKPLPQKWWIYGEKRPALYATIADLPRVLVAVQTSKYVSIEFQPSTIICSHMTVVFALTKMANFAALNTTFHHLWIDKYCSKLEDRLRYIPSDGFDPFPFPRLKPELERDLESVGASYHEWRRSRCLERGLGLTKLYNLFHEPQTQSDQAFSLAAPPFDDIRHLRALHQQMDELVARAYGWDDVDLGHGFHETAQGVRFTLAEPARREVLDRLLALNHQRFATEVADGLHDKKSKKKGRGGQGELGL